MEISNKLNEWLRKFVYEFVGLSQNDFMLICFVWLMCTSSTFFFLICAIVLIAALAAN